MNGNYILVYSDSTLIGGIKSNSLHTGVGMDEVAAPGLGTDNQGGKWKCFTPGRKEGYIQTNYLVMTTSALGVSGGNGVRDVLETGKSFTLHFKGRNAADASGVSGTFYLETCDIQANRGNLVVGNFKFRLAGPLT